MLCFLVLGISTELPSLCDPLHVIFGHIIVFYTVVTPYKPISRMVSFITK